MNQSGFRQALLRALRRILWLCVLSVVFIAAEALCSLYIPTSVERMVDGGVAAGNFAAIRAGGLRLLAVVLLGLCCAVGRTVFSHNATQRFGAAMREAAFDRVVSLSQSEQDRIGSGSLITRVTNDTERLVSFLGTILRIFCKSAVTAVGSLVLCFRLDWRLSAVFFAAAAISLAMILAAMKLSFVRFSGAQRATDRINSIVQEYLGAVRLFRAYHRTDAANRSFGAENTALSESTFRSNRAFAVVSPAVTLTLNLSIAAALLMGGAVIGKQPISVGKLSAYLTFVAQFVTSMLAMMDVFRAGIRARAAGKRLRELFAADTDAPDETAFSPQDTDALLELRDVRFSYPGSAGAAISGVSFSLRRGERLAVIGPTASGKSTLAWICAGLYAPDGGAVLLQGEPASLPLLRRQTSISPQYSILFSGTVSDNLRRANALCTDEELRRAARAAQADGFVSALPGGYEHVLSQGTSTLSGGQKQRLNLARALLKPAPVLILDDCTSALDANTGARVLRAIEQDASDRALLLITQSVEIARRADRILMLEDGAVMGLGTHEQLLSSCASYRELYRSQSFGEEATA